MSYNLFLDDFRTPQVAYRVVHDPRYNNLSWVIAKDYNEFVKRIEDLGIPDLVAFDHDLADAHYNECQKLMTDAEYDTLGEKTGYHAAKYLVNKCVLEGLSIPDYIIHTQNYNGGLAIRSIMESGKKIIRIAKEAQERGETLDTLPEYDKPL